MVAVTFPKYDVVKDFKAVLLDLDNTLYLYHPCHEAALGKVYEYFKIRGVFNDFALFKKEYDFSRRTINIDLAGTGASHSRFLYFKLLVEKFYLKTDISRIQLLENIYWCFFINSMVLFDGVIEFLDQCVKNKIKICIVTDLTTDIQFRKIVQLGLDKYVDFITTSEEVGVEKPHPYIFIKSLEKLNMTVNEVVMIGDDFNKDIVGAMNLEIQWIQLNKNE